MKKLKKSIAAAVILLVIALTLGFTYTYLFGAMTRDRELDTADLSVVDTTNIVREKEKTPVISEGILDEDGNLSEFCLPDEALAILNRTTEKETSPPDTETVPPETETSLPETTVETTAAESAIDITPPETSAETNPPDTAVETTAAKTAEEENRSYLLPGADKIKTFVLYGLDVKQASDAIILTAVDPVHTKLKIISIARDTYSYIKDKDAHTKLNYAYSMGGAALAIKTLNENFHLNIEDYVSVDFQQAKDVVDALGGADVTLDETELLYLGSPEGISVGKAHLNGEYTVAYSRLREMDNDLVRNTRQREVIASLFEQLKSLGLTEYPNLIRSTAAMCTTSFTNAELLSLGTSLLSMKNCTFEQYNYPNASTECWSGEINEQFYFVYDLDLVSDEIYKIIYEDLYVSAYH